MLKVCEIKGCVRAAGLGGQTKRCHECRANILRQVVRYKYNKLAAPIVEKKTQAEMEYWSRKLNEEVK